MRRPRRRRRITDAQALLFRTPEGIYREWYNRFEEVFACWPALTDDQQMALQDMGRRLAEFGVGAGFDGDC